MTLAHSGAIMRETLLFPQVTEVICGNNSNDDDGGGGSGSNDTRSE